MLSAFREVLVVDFEYTTSAPPNRPGDRPQPLCVVVHELKSGRHFHLWYDELGTTPPWAQGPDTLVVAYYASAELVCYKAQGWPMPPRILDLFAEFRDKINGISVPGGASLLGALTYHGLTALEPLKNASFKLRSAMAHGPTATRRPKSLTIARAMSLPSSGFSLPCCRISTCQGPFCAGAMGQRWPLWSGPAPPSISRNWHY
jgi:hypothetical protein